MDVLPFGIQKHNLEDFFCRVASFDRILIVVLFVIRLRMGDIQFFSKRNMFHESFFRVTVMFPSTHRVSSQTTGLITSGCS